MRALIVRATFRDFLRAGAQAGNRDDDFDRRCDFPVADFSDQRDIVVNDALTPETGAALLMK